MILPRCSSHDPNCIIEGGADSDIIFGNVNGDNQLFGDSRPEGDLATVIATLIDEGEEAPDSGTRGDIVAAGERTGDNFLFGSHGYDIIFGITTTNGSGTDLIVAGGGNDLIISDAGDMWANFEDLYTWAFHIEEEFDQVNKVIKYTPVITGLYDYDTDSPFDNDDLIYAGTGNDFVYAGGGDDFIEGGAGNDTIFGEANDDKIDGGSGDDVLYSGGGNDVLYSGGGNKDTLLIALAKTMYNGKRRNLIRVDFEALRRAA